MPFCVHCISYQMKTLENTETTLTAITTGILIFLYKSIPQKLRRIFVRCAALSVYAVEFCTIFKILRIPAVCYAKALVGFFESASFFTHKSSQKIPFIVMFIKRINIQNLPCPFQIAAVNKLSYFGKRNSP